MKFQCASCLSTDRCRPSKLVVRDGSRKDTWYICVKCAEKLEKALTEMRKEIIGS